jgi:hypothetical protein
MIDTCNACARGWEAPQSSRDTCGVFWRLNDSFHNDLEKAEASPLVWRDAWHCLLMVCHWQTLLFSFLTHPLKINISHSKFQSCHFIYWYFNFSFFFSGPLVEFQFAFNFIIWSIIVICYFFLNLILLFNFDLFSDPYVNSNFLFNFSINSKF